MNIVNGNEGGRQVRNFLNKELVIFQLLLKPLI